MGQFSAGASAKYPGLTFISSDLDARSDALYSIKESLEIHERRTGDTDGSFVRVQDFIDLGWLDKKGASYILRTVNITGSGAGNAGLISLVSGLRGLGWIHTELQLPPTRASIVFGFDVTSSLSASKLAVSSIAYGFSTASVLNATGALVGSITYGFSETPFLTTLNPIVSSIAYGFSESLDLEIQGTIKLSVFFGFSESPFLNKQLRTKHLGSYALGSGTSLVRSH